LESSGVEVRWSSWGRVLRVGTGIYSKRPFRMAFYRGRAHPLKSSGKRERESAWHGNFI
jgi:hypothetical protein